MDPMPPQTPDAFRKRLVATWFQFDPRSLGLFRIGFSLLLFWDLLRRVPDLAVWYSNQGLLPNHTQLWRPASEHVFSLFFVASHPGEAAFGFFLCGLVYLGLLLGYRTKLFQVLALLAVVSLHSRAVILENGGDVVMNLLAVWSMFLPLGRRFSVDALLRSLRRTRESTAAELGSHRLPDEEDRLAPATSLAVFAILVQLSVIYFFNAIHKGGAAWKDGSVVHWVLYQDRIVTWLGALVRDGFPMGLSKAFAWATLAAEGAAPLLVLTPFGTLHARRLAMVALPAMHLGFAIFLNVGLFSPVMCAFFLLLPSAQDWQALGSFWKKRAKALTVYFDAGCGICFQVARVLARMDAHALLTFVPNTDAERLPAGVTPELVEKTIVVTEEDGRQRTRAAAFAQIFRSIPGGSLVSAPLSLPPIGALAGGVYDSVARNRQRISMSLGLAACGLPSLRSEPIAAPPPPPVMSLVAEAGRILREALVVLLVVATTSQMLVENRAVPRWMKAPQPDFLRAIVQYGRFFQGWSMFAPNPPTTNGLMVVEATTADGRRVDPLNHAATGWKGEPWAESPGRLGQDQFWCDYVARIERNRHLHHILESWIIAHHKRTGRDEDRIVAFDAYWLEHQTPPPGQGQGLGPVTRRKFASWKEEASDKGVVKR